MRRIILLGVTGGIAFNLFQRVLDYALDAAFSRVPWLAWLT